MIVPVTTRGDAIGLLELLLPAEPGDDVLDEVGEAAPILACVVIANGRFTDLHAWDKRSRPATSAAENQYQLLLPPHCRARPHSAPCAGVWSPRPDWHGPQQTLRHVSSGADTQRASASRVKQQP
ncbi:hypothetical protein AB0N31_04460 [Streptomyces sp. NPDC051051]|uniref:hypothetical protein n=1 Tax=Streptomyces sp. NPDC051051 TaxID=3155666 RepID=UPI0034467EB9